MARGQVRQPVSDIKRDERVLFFPTAAWLEDGAKNWIVPIHGWIFEPESDDLLRRAAMGRLRRALGLDPDRPSSAVFEQRVGWFLVDNERGKRIAVRIAGRHYTLPASQANGHFAGTVRIAVDQAARAAAGDRLPLSAVMPAGDPRAFGGVVHLIPPRGISAISDIDDTVKITGVTDKKQLAANTFFRPFRAVTGMADVYRRWSRQGVQFHFVSASPWQLYEPLSAFLKDAGFPEATYHLKRFRLKDSSLRNLFADPLEAKLQAIEPMFSRYPNRRFVLVGDSGERDPEVYATLALRHPDQVVRIYIRDVTGEPADGVRYRKAFEKLPVGMWRLFEKPSTLAIPHASE